MTTFFPFIQQGNAPFSFQPVLSGTSYTATIKFNLEGQRYYFNLNQMTGPLVVCRALVGSPDAVSIESLTWSFGTVTAITGEPHNYTVGQCVDITVAGCVPTAYNGIVSGFIVDAFTFTYDLQANPGLVTRLGTAVYNVNLVQYYTDPATLVYRTSSNTFEVTP